MDLKGIISISGKPGLSKIISQSRGGLIAESLQDGKRFAIHGAERVSSLEDISIFTHEEDLLLSEVFEKIYKAGNGKKVLSHKSEPEELRNFLKDVLPNYDENRVYNSDIKKLIQWYNILIDQDLLKPTEVEPDSEKPEEKKKESSTKSTKAVKNATKENKPKVKGQESKKTPKAAKPKATPAKKNTSRPSSKGK